MEDLLSCCERSVRTGDPAAARRLAEEVLERGLDIETAIEDGFARGMRRVGREWAEGRAFLPDVAFSAEAMKAALEVLTAAAPGTSRGPKVVIGTVEGDIHDIGKTLVGIMLAAHGHEVVDLGVDVPGEKFLQAVRDGAEVVGMSALLTTTMPYQRRVVDLLEREGLRERVKVVVGGAPTSAGWARRIGADGYAENALDAIRVVGALTGREESAA